MERPTSDIETALRVLSEVTGRRLRALGQYTHGEFGTYRVEDEAGARYALKFSSEQRLTRAAATTRALAASGYPAPEYMSIGQVSREVWCALLQELPGRPMERITLDVADQLLALNAMQAGRALLPADERRVVDTLLVGAEGYALHDAMRVYSTATAALLDAIVAIGMAHADLDFPLTDVVHQDFHIGNVLVADGQVSGVVDWEGAHTGDRAFDVATLLFYCLEDETVERRLWEALLDLCGPARSSVYLAHMMLRQVDWSARHHPLATVERFLDRSARLLSHLQSLG